LPLTGVDYVDWLEIEKVFSAPEGVWVFEVVNCIITIPMALRYTIVLDGWSIHMYYDFTVLFMNLRWKCLWRLTGFANQSREALQSISSFRGMI
jgi:hypothetical protein